MLFNDPIFIFAFLPITLVGYYLLAFRWQRPALVWLTAASLVFYSWWNPVYLPLIAVSIVVNYAFGRLINGQQVAKRRKLALTVGLVFNLGLLGYYKYANFFIEAVNRAAHANLHAANIALPLAISFFTFTEIAYLVDTYRGSAKEHHFLNYALFVTFFPHLIAGPIVHHSQLIPQFLGERRRFRMDDFTIGLSIFLIGLFKKVLVADAISPCAVAAFHSAATGQLPQLCDAWGGVLAFTLQIYFDFSGYSDMAIGLARMFGIRFPVNFNSPYKSASIIEFWRRWHITLSVFLRDYLYFPLGGNRHGAPRRYANLMITMLLGGLWHGAGWTFVLWGGLHGAYLAVNHGWRSVLNSRPAWTKLFGGRAGAACGGVLTFLAVMVGWVFFRADNLATARRLLRGMDGRSGISPGQLGLEGLFYLTLILWAILALPNTQQFMADAEPAAEPVEYKGRFRWRGPTPMIGLAFGALLFLVLKGFFSSAPSEFLYFRF